MDPLIDRLFLDTGYVMARFNRRDQYHQVAGRLSPLMANCRELWTTDAVLLEIAAAFSHPNQRDIAVRLWDQFHSSAVPYRVIECSGRMMQEAMTLYRSRTDKSWSLTDCLSFVVKKQEGLTAALTPDQHFPQAGFRALMLEEQA